MLKTPLVVTLLLFSCFAYAQSSNPKYDKTLADSLGADEYGMKYYVLVILKIGANITENKQAVDSLFMGHMNNIGRLATMGKLVLAGPIKKNDKSYRGIFVLNVKTIDEADELLLTDPAIKAKLLEPELYQWYATASLPLIPKMHEKMQKKKF